MHTRRQGDLIDSPISFHHLFPFPNSGTNKLLSSTLPFLSCNGWGSNPRPYIHTVGNYSTTELQLQSKFLLLHNFSPSFLLRIENKPSIFLPKSWNCFLFFLSSSSIFWRSSTSCCRRFRASASRSALERNLGFKTDGNEYQRAWGRDNHITATETQGSP